MINENPFKHLFKKVQERINAEVPEIKFVDEDKGQLEAYDGRPAVSWPCVLIDFDFNFDDLGDNIQEADGVLQLRLGFPPYSSANSLMPDAVKDKALSYFDYEYQLYKALQGWKPEGFSYLSRRSAKTEDRPDNIRVRSISFSVQFDDHGAQPERAVTQLNTVEIGAQPCEEEG